jgi:hypothetical protein
LLELDSRREVGIIFRDPKVVSRLVQTFRKDWESGGKSAVREPSPEEVEQAEAASASKVAKRVAKAVVNELRPVTPVVETTVRKLSDMAPEVNLNEKEIEATVRTAVQDAVRQVVRDFVEEAVEAHGAESRSAASKTAVSKT